MPRPTSIYATSPRSPREPDIGSRALLEADTPKSDHESEMGGPQGFLSPTGREENKVESSIKLEDKKEGYMVVIVAPIVVQLIGIGIALCVYIYGGRAAYAAKMTDVAAAGLHCIFASAGLFAYTVRVLNFFPMAAKNMIMAGALKEKLGINARSNPFIYRSLDGHHTVIFDNEGPVGRYNRANRSLHHFVETSSPVLVCLILAGYVFPFPAFVCIAIFCAGRILHQVGYATGYGGHGAGFGIATLASCTLEGLVILVALAGAGVLD